MIITRTPLRVSFLGGGTDYPAHYLKNGGQTLGAAMNRYTFITVKRLPDLFEYKIRAAYSKIELCADLDSVDHQVGDQAIDLGVLHDHADHPRSTEVTLAELCAGEVLVVEASHADRLGRMSASASGWFGWLTS